MSKDNETILKILNDFKIDPANISDRDIEKMSEKEKKLTNEIEQILQSTDNSEDIAEKVVSLIKQHRENDPNITDTVRKTVDADLKVISKGIKDICLKFLENRRNIKLKESKEEELKSKKKIEKNRKKLIMNFVVYEIYKIMNPKRIAGETEKDNYRNNLALKGKKHATKYFSGAAYNYSQMNKVEKEAKSLRRDINKGFSR